jgi:hypothetical protein
MTRSTIIGGACVATLALFVVALMVRNSTVGENVDPIAEEPSAQRTASAGAEGETTAAPGFIYGRITDGDGAIYEGRLRWGRNEEAFWSDYFNGVKDENPWAAHAPLAQQPSEQTSVEIFGIALGGRSSSMNLERPFMVRFGDIARIDAHVKDVQVALKSGSRFTLDRFEAGDMDDTVRVWDATRGVVDLDSRRIRTIELLPTASLADVPERLYGTVRSRAGDFTGYIQWNRQDCVGADELSGYSDQGKVGLRYDTIRSIARQSRDSVLVTLVDGGERLLTNRAAGRSPLLPREPSYEVGQGNRGVYVDDARYGRVLVSWDAFERVDFSKRDSGPGYDDFAPGRPLRGTVTTQDGRQLAGRLVYDFDESETNETLDAAREGVDYTITFSLIASILPRGRADGSPNRPTVMLRDGEELQLDRSGDLGEGNAGMLIFVDGRQRPDYVRWTDVARIDFDRVAPDGA